MGSNPLTERQVSFIFRLSISSRNDNGDFDRN